MSEVRPPGESSPPEAAAAARAAEPVGPVGPVDAARPPGAARPARPLSVGTEVRRQLGRPRTRWAFGLMLALPAIIVLAFTLGTRGPAGGLRISDFAREGSANFTIFVLISAADFLFVVLAALFAGDSVPSEASWSSLRYLLVAPVPRARLLTAKWLVALLTVAFAVVLYVVWALLLGGLVYGWAPFTIPTGGVIEWDVMLPRIGIAAAYIFVTLLQVAALAFLIGTRTDAPLGAVGIAVLTAIICSILGQIEDLGAIRNALPLHYQRAWLDLVNPDPDWLSMRHGVVWSLFWTVLFLGLAWRVFRRKDVLS